MVSDLIYKLRVKPLLQFFGRIEALKVVAKALLFVRQELCR